MTTSENVYLDRDDDDRELPVARLRGPGDLIAAVPHLIGYHPSESFVAVSLRGERARLGVTMCGSLPDPSGVRAQAADTAARLAQNGGDRAILMIFTEASDDGPNLPYRGFAEAVRRQAERRSVLLLDALLLRDGRRWSYLCRDPRCCPPTGVPLVDDEPTPALSLLVAEHVAEGRGPLASRDMLVASLAAPEGPARRDMERAFDRARASRADRDTAIDRTGSTRAALARWRSALDRFSAPPATLSEDEAALLMLDLIEVRVRDEVATWSLDSESGLRALVTELCRKALPPYDAPVCSLLAWIAYAAGDGATANVALDRALASQPDYSLAGLLRHMLDAQVHPREARRVLSDSRREIKAREARRRRRSR